MKYEEVIQKIKNKTPFAFSRWGDGEFLTVNGSVGQNCDGNVYYKDLGDSLKSILNVRQEYYMGIQTLIPDTVKEGKKYNQNWCDSDVFHKASMKGILNEFINVLKDTEVVYIGNEKLSKLSFINQFIEIPYNNVWLKKDLILSEIIDTFSENYKVYCLSAGMAANIFVDKLWKRDKTNTYIDVGSVFDPYVGRITRTYHKNLNINVKS